MVDDARSGPVQLPDEVLLVIFRYLNLENLQLAEQVCEKWKVVVGTSFATKKLLAMRNIHEETDCVKLLKRCGPSLRTVVVSGCALWIKNNHWIRIMANSFPSIESLSFKSLHFENEEFLALSLQCRKIKSISFICCRFPEEGLKLLLKMLPGLQCLEIRGYPQGNLDESLSNLGSNLDYLNLSCGMTVTREGFSHVWSKCKKLKTLELSLWSCDKDVFYNEGFSQWCQDNVYIRRLAIEFSLMRKTASAQISCLSQLEELELHSCFEVDSDTLIAISQGCLNLRRVGLYDVKNICDCGVKSLTRCRNLIEFCCSSCIGVTEESLIELGKACSLKIIEIRSCLKISNHSCAAIIGHCPQLEVLDVSCCKGVADGIVDIAIQAIENRANAVVLHLHVGGTGVNPRKEISSHPLLQVHHELRRHVSTI